MQVDHQRGYNRLQMVRSRPNLAHRERRQLNGERAAGDRSIKPVDSYQQFFLYPCPPAARTPFSGFRLNAGGRSIKLYWADREGMRVMRSNLDGSQIETLVQAGYGDADRSNPANWCVGITVDTDSGHLYWTQKGGDNAEQGRILCANMELPQGQTAANRRDVIVLFDPLMLAWPWQAICG
jgi:hypothetical protein